MAKKLSKRTACAVCLESTDDAKVGEYVEIEITVPEATGEARQYFGAHTVCLNGALGEGRQVEVDLLVEPELLPANWRDVHREWLGT